MGLILESDNSGGIPLEHLKAGATFKGHCPTDVFMVLDMESIWKLVSPARLSTSGVAVINLHTGAITEFAGDSLVCVVDLYCRLEDSV